MAIRPVGIARRENLERRYDVLPPWAWRRPRTAVERLEAMIGATESLLREAGRAPPDAQDRSRRAIFALSVARHRAVLARVKAGPPAPMDR